MEAARALVDLRKQLRRLEDAVSTLEERVAKCNAIIEHYMEEGEFPFSSSVDGATVYRSVTIRASAKNKDHERLTAVLDELGLVEYLPKTVNANTISGYVREHLDPDESKSLDERLATLDPRLRDALNIYEDVKVKVVGA